MQSLWVRDCWFSGYLSSSDSTDTVWSCQHLCVCVCVCVWLCFFFPLDKAERCWNPMVQVFWIFSAECIWVFGKAWICVGLCFCVCFKVYSQTEKRRQIPRHHSVTDMANNQSALSSPRTHWHREEAPERERERETINKQTNTFPKEWKIN